MCERRNRSRLRAHRPQPVRTAPRLAMPPLARDVAGRLVDAVAALQQEHRQQRVRVSPDDMLAQLKVREQAFAAVKVSQVRRAITAANNRGESMDVEPATAATASASASASSSSSAAAPSDREHQTKRLRSAASTVVEPAFTCAFGNVPKLIFEPEPQPPPPNYLEHLERRWGFTDGFWSTTHTEDREMDCIGFGRRHSL